VAQPLSILNIKILQQSLDNSVSQNYHENEASHLKDIKVKHKSIATIFKYNIIFMHIHN